MKAIVVGALLAGSVMAPNAFAEVRTFDFTAAVSSLASVGNPVATSLPGLNGVGSIALGDAITGSVAFDDAGVNWASNTFSGFLPVTSFTLHIGGQSVTLDQSLFAYTPNFIGNKDAFNVTGTNAADTASANLFLYSPHDAFTWQLGGQTSATLAFAWDGANGAGPFGLNAKLSSIVEVTPVPEPSTYGMLLLGAGVIAGAARRRKSRQA